MKLLNPQIWTRAALLAVPVFAIQVSVSQLQSDLGFQPLSSAIAQEEQKKPQRETRRTPALRRMVGETHLSASDFIYPLFVRHGNGRSPIASMPGIDQLFSAFRRDRHNLRYILIGESPYPRAESANGIAFYDAAVNALWSETGLSKPVNRATSMRNIIKTALLAEGLIETD